jgi:hypothetical protein
MRAATRADAWQAGYVAAVRDAVAAIRLATGPGLHREFLLDTLMAATIGAGQSPPMASQPRKRRRKTAPAPPDQDRIFART